jgi:hypothetical protein
MRREANERLHDAIWIEHDDSLGSECFCYHCVNEQARQRFGFRFDDDALGPSPLSHEASGATTMQQQQHAETVASSSALPTPDDEDDIVITPQELLRYAVEAPPPRRRRHSQAEAQSSVLPCPNVPPPPLQQYGEGDPTLTFTTERYLRDRHMLVTVSPSSLIVDIAAYLQNNFANIQAYISNQLNLNDPYKFQMQVNAQFSKNGTKNVDLDLENEDEGYTRTFYMSTSAVILGDLQTDILDSCEKLKV